jgi:alpha-tubulin suppressor-like RCC1 family protein
MSTATARRLPERRLLERRLPEFGLRVAVALAVVGAAFALLDGPARGDIGEAAVASVADKQRLMALGTRHSCAVTDDGRVECWGDNDDGQLGNGTLETSTTPVPVVGLTGVRQVSAGAQHTCALLQDGSVRCWGLGGSGQLGNGGTDSHTTPVVAQGITGATAIAVGGFHGCALLADRTVRCWGQDGLGELGDGNGGDFHATPVAVASLADVTALASGAFHTCALVDDGTVSCWGHNGYGQLGDGTKDDTDEPVAVAGLPDAATRPALAVSAGNGHTCVVVGAPMNAYCWGLNADGQLGHKTAVVDTVMQPSTAPLVVQFDADASPLTEDPQTLPGTASVSTGEFHTCAKVGGSAWCWGRNDNGQLGTDPMPGSGESAESEPYENSTYALPVAGISVAAVAAGGYHSCALVGAAMRCWGMNFHGQLGGYAAQSNVPVIVTAIQGATRVAAGTEYACALLDDPPSERRPSCWGSNADGRLGSGSAVALTTTAQPVAGLGATQDLDLGNGHGCASVDGSTTLHCWGRNSDGQLGDGTTMNRPTPVTSVASVTAYDAGGRLGAAEEGFTCARRATGTASCWGENGRGQLGDGTTTQATGPVTVQYDSDPDEDEVTETDLTGVTDVAAGGSHACALLSNGTVRCWGLNSSGQLADNTFTERHLAVLVQDDDDDEADIPLTGVVDITAGARHTCALKPDGTVRCWGRGMFGQLGDGAGTARNNATEPVVVDGADLEDAKDVRAGDNHTCAEREDKGVVCWGDNSHGQSGGGDAKYDTGHYVIEPPGEDFDGDLVTSLSASRENTCVTFIDQTVRCWGDNSHGQLGDGLGHRSLAPVLVGALPGVSGNHIPEPLPDTVTTTPGTPVTVDALANDTDPDGDTLTLNAVEDPVLGDTAIVVGQVHYTPGPGCYDETFTYTVSDGTAPVTSTITVLMNCAPVAADDTATTEEDTAEDVAVLANDSDPEDDSLTVTVTGAPAHGTATVNPDETVRYIPEPDFCSAPADSFVYEVDDGQGHQDQAVVTVTVDCGADAPAPGADAVSTPEDTPVDVDVLANDTDADGQSLTLVSVGPPAHGTAAIVAGQVRYSPATDYCGPDAFTYTVGDGGQSATGHVTVSVVCAGDSPRPSPDAATTTEDTSVLVDVLANDSDPDPDPDNPDPDNLSLGTLGDPAHGTVAAEAGKVRYTPSADFCGSDAFTYTVKDETGLTATGTAEVAVTCVNDAPVAAPDTATTDEDETVHVHVLTNDVDVDDDTLTITSADGAAHGTLSLAIVDAVAYTPDPGFCGEDSFSYTVDDGNGGTDTAAVLVTVTCVNDPVQVGDVADQETPWGSLLAVPLTATDADPGDPITWSLVSGPAGALVVTSGELRWTPTAGQVGRHQVTVAVTDGVAVDQVTFAVTVVKRATAVAYDGATSGQVSDRAGVSGQLYDVASGLPIAGEPLEFALGSATSGASTDADGRAATTVAVLGPVGTRPVSVAYAGDAAYLPASVSTPFTVAKENLTLALAGQTLVVSAAATAPVTLTADVAEEADGAFGGSLSSVQVSFRNADGSLLCTATAAPTTAGRAQAQCTVALPVGARAVVLTASSPAYAGPADVGVVTHTTGASGSAAAAIGTGARDAGFHAVPVRKAPPAGNAVLVVPGFGSLVIVEASSLSSLTSACAGKPRTCTATVLAGGATLRTIDLMTGTTSPPSGTADLRLDVADLAEPGVGVDTWAEAVTGGIVDTLGTPSAQVPIGYGNVRVSP